MLNEHNSITPTFLMCSPENLVFPDSATPDSALPNAHAIAGRKKFWQNPDAFRKEIASQSEALAKKIKKLGGNVLFQEPSLGFVGQAYTADPSVSLTTISDDQKTLHTVTVLSTFTNPIRKQETQLHAAFLKALGDNRSIVQSNFAFEGSGDNVYDPYRGIFWSGYVSNTGKNPQAGRSDKQSHTLLSDETGVEVISLHVASDNFHIDTSLAPLPNGHMLSYSEGVTEESYKHFLKNAFERFEMPQEDYLISVDKEDADRFACNVICIGNNIIIPECSDGLLARIESLGYSPHPVDVSRFLQGGGGVHCIANRINQPRTIGGLHSLNL